MTDQAQDTAASAASSAGAPADAVDTNVVDMKSRLIAAVKRSPWTVVIFLAIGAGLGVAAGTWFF